MTMTQIFYSFKNHGSSVLGSLQTYLTLLVPLFMAPLLMTVGPVSFHPTTPQMPQMYASLPHMYVLNSYAYLPHRSLPLYDTVKVLRP